MPVQRSSTPLLLLAVLLAGAIGLLAAPRLVEAAGSGDGRFRIPKGVSNRMFQHSSSTGGAGGTGYSYSSSGMSWSANGRDGRDGTSGGGGGSGGGFNGGDGGSRGSGGEGQTVLVSPSGRSRATLDRAAGMVTVVSGGSVSQQSLGGNGQISMNGETLIISDRTARWS